MSSELPKLDADCQSPGGAEPAHAFPTPEGPPLPKQVTLQAAKWLVMLQAPNTTQATRAKWQRWRDAHPDHERAWQHIEASATQMRAMHSPLAHGTLIQNDTEKRRARRRAIKLLGVVAFTGTSTWLLRDNPVWREWHADHRTATGERRTIVLADGTQIMLNTASVIDVHFDNTVRLVTLIRGEILVTTAPDSASATGRPFIVATDQGRLRALGTRFTVHQRENDSHVSLFEGMVEIRPTDAPDHPRVLQAGEQISFTRNTIETPQTIDTHAASWVTGMLVVQEMPLTDFIDELARYRPGYLSCDPALSHLKVSGIYPIEDTERVLDMLLHVHPIEIYSLTRYWVAIRARGDR